MFILCGEAPRTRHDNYPLVPLPLWKSGVKPCSTFLKVVGKRIKKVYLPVLLVVYLEEELGEKMCVVEFDAEFMID
jgi:hypothetical protein